MSRSTLGRMAGMFIALAVVISASSLFATAEPAAAAKEKSPVRCPKNIGGFKNDGSNVRDDVIDCYYGMKDWNLRHGGIRLAVFWKPDTLDKRTPCAYRVPPPLDTINGRVVHSIAYRADRNVYGNYHMTKGKSVKRGQVDAALRRILESAAPLAHACIPEDAPVAKDVLACPLVIGDTFVRADWYGKDAESIERRRTDDAGSEYALRCDYRYAYHDEGLFADLSLAWWEGDLDDSKASYFCDPRRHDSGSESSARDGTYPIEVRIDNELAARGGQEAADRLSAIAAKRTPLCPGAASSEPVRITIVLSGGRDDEPPPIGATISLPEADQRDLVVEGPDGGVIEVGLPRKSGTVVGYGPMARDADDNWSVSVDIEVGSTAEPEPVEEPADEPEPKLEPRPEPADEPAGEPEPEPQPEPDDEPDRKPDPEPAEEPEPQREPQPEPEPAEEPEPEQAEDSAAGARKVGEQILQDLRDQLDAAAEEETGSGTISLGAALIERLTNLPIVTERVAEVRLEDGRIAVTARNKDGSPGILIWITLVEREGIADVDVAKPFLDIPVPVTRKVLEVFDPRLPDLIDQVKGDINQELFDRDLVVLDVAVSSGGITARVQKSSK